MKLPIPDDWDGSSWCKWAICWPESEKWEGILRGFITLPHRGRTWDERTGSILDVQAIGREITEENIPLVGVLMACNDTEMTAAFSDIALALRYLADQQFAKPCCDSCGGGGSARSGSGGAPTIAPPFNPVIPGDPDVDEPPLGFETWEDFFTQKCAIAINIVDELESDLGEMALYTFGGITLNSLATLIAITIATPIPFDDIIVIAGLLLTIAAEVVITTSLDIVNVNENELICALYDGTDSSNSRSLFLSHFGSLVDSGVGDPVTAFSCKTLMAYMVSAMVTNRLYVKDLTRVWSGGDCSMCGACVTVNFGIGTVSDDEPYTLESVEEAGVYYVEVISDVDIEFEVISTDGYTVGAQATGIQNAAGNWLWRWNVDGDPPPISNLERHSRGLWESYSVHYYHVPYLLAHRCSGKMSLSRRG